MPIEKVEVEHFVLMLVLSASTSGSALPPPLPLFDLPPCCAPRPAAPPPAFPESLLLVRERLGWGPRTGCRRSFVDSARGLTSRSAGSRGDSGGTNLMKSCSGLKAYLYLMCPLYCSQRLSVCASLNTASADPLSDEAKQLRMNLAALKFN